MIEFHKYAKIQNNYCICYFGSSDEYLVQLRLLHPIIMSHFPNLNLWFGCRDDKTHLLKDLNIMKVSEIKTKRLELAHIKEIKFNGLVHPIEELFSESGITNYKLNIDQKEPTNKCVIITQGNYPTKPLERKTVDKIANTYKQKGYDIEIDKDIYGAGLVIGVESVGLFEAIGQGIETKLVPTGVGTQLYKQMTSFKNVLNI